MTVMSGELLRKSGIILNGVNEKVDDKILPSYGMDGALYTFRARETFGNLDVYHLPPFRSISLLTLEEVWIPHDCIGRLYPKSTYSRQGVILVTNSPVDPGYKGPLAIRLFNTNFDQTVDIFLRGGLMQMVVDQLDDETRMGYNGRWAN